jgi:hypothetical protein
LLPGFWRVIGPALPNGAGVEALRRIVYFGSYGIAGNLIVIAAYIAAAVAVALVGTLVLNRRATTGEPGADSAQSSSPVVCSAVGRTPARPARQSSPHTGSGPGRVGVRCPQRLAVIDREPLPIRGRVDRQSDAYAAWLLSGAPGSTIGRPRNASSAIHTAWCASGPSRTMPPFSSVRTLAMRPAAASRCSCRSARVNPVDPW